MVSSCMDDFATTKKKKKLAFFLGKKHKHQQSKATTEKGNWLLGKRYMVHLAHCW